MRLFAKIFLCAAFVLSAALLLAGYLLITAAHEDAVEREAARAAAQFQYDKFTVQSAMLTNGGAVFGGAPESFFRNLSAELNGLASFYSEDRRPLYSGTDTGARFTLPEGIPDDAHIVRTENLQGTRFITVSGKISQSGLTLFLLMATDISDIISQKEQMTQSFGRVFFITLLISMALTALLSLFITEPLKRMSKAASVIAKGNYGERLTDSRGDEIGQLADSFNLMADAVQEKINELLINARQKEDFVASFAHELKTPLTSVIGYADLLYQKELTPAEIKEAANYILSEGLRLEALSLKLMDLIILNRNDFLLEAIRADELLDFICGGLKPMLDEKNVTLTLGAEPAYVMVEFDLFKTLLLNLIDNAVKANCDEIKIEGSRDGDGYVVKVTDDGGGIPEKELARVREAFYTVDKSRSRKQHGAGLGLALAERIAVIHGSGLAFESRVGEGTAVTVKLNCEETDLC